MLVYKINESLILSGKSNEVWRIHILGCSKNPSAGEGRELPPGFIFTTVAALPLSTSIKRLQQIHDTESFKSTFPFHMKKREIGCCAFHCDSMMQPHQQLLDTQVLSKPPFTLPSRKCSIKILATHGCVKSCVTKSELLKSKKMSLRLLHFKELFNAIQ